VVLLDTCAMIWLFERQPMTAASRQEIQSSAVRNGVLVSPVSAWEIGLLATSRGSGLQFAPSPDAWWADLLRLEGVRLTQLLPDAAIAASYLPGFLHRDPADRLLIATARALDVPIVTRDERILAYAEQGHVRVVAC
jgi:PIN domain nuclease of toxin-antitoxin system